MRRLRQNDISKIVSVLLLCTVLLSPLAVAAPRVFTPEESQTIGIYQKNSPAVVNVMTAAVTFDFFLNPIPKQGSGSGFIISPDGYVLTNYHVVQNAQMLKVSLSGGEEFQAKLVGVDPSTDLAVLKIESKTPLPTVLLGTSADLVVGQAVYVIGNPFGLKGTYTTGVISSLNRSLKTPNNRLLDDVIQTDAAINPGNSGGPLIDSQGRVIGMNTAIFSPSGASAGIGFAVPIDRINRIFAEIKQTGKVERPYLGLTIGLEVNPLVAQKLNLPVKQGLMVSEVTPNSPASKAGVIQGVTPLRLADRVVLFGGDIITKVDGKPIATAQEFISRIESKRPGQLLTLTVIRGGREASLPVKLEQRPQGL